MRVDSDIKLLVHTFIPMEIRVQCDIVASDSSLMTTPAALPSSYEECMLDSLLLVSGRIHAALANRSVLILHRTQWQCLANSHSEVLRVLAHLVQHDCNPLLDPSKIDPPLYAVLCSMQESERCIEECTASCPSSSHSWLLCKALKLGVSSDVVNVHLREFLWAFAAVIHQAIVLQIISVEPDLVQITRKLSELWAEQDAKADLSEACSFLKTIKTEEEGETSILADFILHKLSNAEDLESGELDVLPSYLWMDPGSLTRDSEVLGMGSYGKVHEAGWLGGRFAVKDFFYVENNIVFGREAAIQARLRHPNVISLICCTKNTSLQKCSLVMELMQQDLQVLMMKRKNAGMDPPFSLSVAVDLMLQIAQGLEYLHSLHIMHRDLKSSNILVSVSRLKDDLDTHDMGPCARLKIADFGMSKAKHASSKFTTKPVGATPWRAPEVFESNPEDEVEGDKNSKYTKKADVYSFGLVCYEILTGKSPFDGPHVRSRVLAGERPLLPSYCPSSLSSYIKTCWHGDPWRRPPFTQICRMLRYLKICLLLQDSLGQSPTHHSWLSHPLSPDVCARIDEMLISFVEPTDTSPPPQPLNIPLEMHYCRVVLHGREDNQNICNKHANCEIDITLSHVDVELKVFSEHSSPTDDGLQRNGRCHGKCNTKALRLFRQLFCMQSAQLSKSELEDALCLVRDFTLEELRHATASFSKVLGEGGTGKVYYGKLEDGREIAVKAAIRPEVLRSGHIGSSCKGKGLVQELKIASQLRHRNIVPLIGWCKDQGKLLLVYQYMPNGNLAKHIFGEQQCSLSWQLMYKVICQLASALKYLHEDASELQIVHRDVKAANVLLDSEWNARLGDCGLAVLLRKGDAAWQTLAGTHGYIAPENVTQRRVSPASDVYAFGVTVLEIATGRRAYTYDPVGEPHFIRDWALKLYQLGDLVQLTNTRFTGKYEEDKINRLLLLSLTCTDTDPRMRPPMDEVLKILSGSSEPPPLRSQIVQCSSSSRVGSSSLASTSSWSSWNSTIKHMPSDGMTKADRQTPRLEKELHQNSKARVFTFKELQIATGHFQNNKALGEGGFGRVYKGSVKGIDGPTCITVAIKVLHENSLQGRKEWLAEVTFLGQLDHPHLVKLVGYCSENKHMLLVYEFMEGGSLENHLFQKSKIQPLSWARRMKVALGAAKGLAFLHGLERPILFRDMKTSNILVDSAYTAKLSDFGLAKDGPMGDKTHVTTRVMGTFGYAAPEYIMTGHLTAKSDVYSFGVVLLELLTGQRVVDKAKTDGKQYLVEWARPYLQGKKVLSQIVDPHLGGSYSLKEARKLAALTLQCLSFDPKARPTMGDAVQTLEGF